MKAVQVLGQELFLKNMYSNHKKTVVILLTCLILIPVTIVAAQNKFYRFELDYESGTIKLDRVTVADGEISRGIEPEKGYKLELAGANGEVLDILVFSAPSAASIEKIDTNTGKIISSQTVQIEKTKFTLSMPYYADGKTISLYSPDGAKLAEKGINPSSSGCSDKICQVELQQTKTVKPKSNRLNVAAIIFAVLILALFLIYLIKKKTLVK